MGLFIHDGLRVSACKSCKGVQQGRAPSIQLCYAHDTREGVFLNSYTVVLDEPAPPPLAGLLGLGLTCLICL
jgi:hypothetical protein